MKKSIKKNEGPKYKEVRRPELPHPYAINPSGVILTTKELQEVRGGRVA